MKRANCKANSAFYPRPRRGEIGLERLPGSTSWVRAVGAGLAPDLCSRGVRPLRILSDGAGGFLPGVPWECLDTGITFEAPSPRGAQSLPTISISRSKP